MASFLRCDVKPTTIAICAAALCGRIQRIPLPCCSAYIDLRDNRPFGRTVRLQFRGHASAGDVLDFRVFLNPVEWPK